MPNFKENTVNKFLNNLSVLILTTKRSLRARSERAGLHSTLLQLNLPIAVIETNYNEHSINVGKQTGFVYSELLEIPVAFNPYCGSFVRIQQNPIALNI